MTEDKVKFIQLIGVAGSGKSTVAEELVEGRDDTIIISSDSLREELLNDVNDQGSNTDIFAEMLVRTKQALQDGKNVIYDATNISRKKRKGLLQQLPKDVNKIALYIATPYDKIVEQNRNRERVVPEGVIERMYKNMQIPIYSEGWDKIVFEYDIETIEEDLPKQFTDAVRAGILIGREEYGVMMFLAEYFNEFFNIYDMPQDSKYHSLSVSRHTYYVYEYVLKNYKTDNIHEQEVMLWTALLHDIGKAFCKSFENRKREITRYANFIGHEHVSSQLAIPLLKRLNFEDETIHKVATLIQFHMYLLDDNANRNKLKERVGEEMFAQLEFLRDADNYAH